MIDGTYTLGEMALILSKIIDAFGVAFLMAVGVVLLYIFMAKIITKRGPSIKRTLNFTLKTLLSIFFVTMWLFLFKFYLISLSLVEGNTPFYFFLTLILLFLVSGKAFEGILLFADAVKELERGDKK